jgi:protein transport protein DSL1/ZW10
LSDIIDAILAIEEFSVDDCQCLQRVLEYVSDQAVDLFRTSFVEPSGAAAAAASTSKPEVTVHEVAPSWMRIRELALLLGAGLKDVDDRWSDGKGPLALYFSGDDVARFVTAAFEKTSRRDVLVTRLRKHHNKTCAI